MRTAMAQCNDMASTTITTCDGGCGASFNSDDGRKEGHEVADGFVHLRGFSGYFAGDHELDVCRGCWAKMLAAIGRTPADVGTDEASGGTWDCGCSAAAHPNAPNMLRGAAENDGPVCSFGWPRKADEQPVTLGS